MAFKSSLLDQVKAAVEAEKLIDQTEDTGGNFEYQLPPAGLAAARLIGYVELGKRKQNPFQGKPKADCLEARITFELFGKSHQNEIEVDGVKTVVHNTISTKIAVKSGDRASFYKLLKAMAYGRTGISHMAQMLGDAFLLEVVHKDNGKTGDEHRVYANFRREDGSWTVRAPMHVYNLGEDPRPVAVPEPTHKLQLLLWDLPSHEQWDSIFVDGTRSVKEGDKEVLKSRNWLQEDIVKNATNFKGSALEALLNEKGGLVLDGGQAKAEAQAQAEVAPAAAPVPAVDADPLAGLNLDDEIPF